ncbi:MAG: GNAT family N-acetyltransferase [Clostridiales bacterium]|nr:GNAT family N-acetyltransferase [Clostridiales bacterium]
MKLEIRDIKLADVYTMTNWGKFTDIRYLHFNFRYNNIEEFKAWYKYKVEAIGIKTFGAFIGTQLIGFVSLKNINYILNRAELGVIFDINYASKGYGYTTIKEVLKKVKFKKVYLYVSTYNIRAYNTYIKLGFVSVKNVYKVFENQDIIDEIQDENQEFLKKNGKLYGKYIKMEKFL